MPELPDIVVYLEALEQRILDQTLERVSIASPFLLRTAVPPVTTVEGRKVVQLRRLGKRICVGFEEDLWFILHLMIAGRLHWKETTHIKARKSNVRVAERGSSPTVKEGSPSRGPKNQLATFIFGNGTLSLTEAGTQRRASLHLVQGEAALQYFNPGGLEIFDTSLEGFATRLQSANHTLKRALTDPRLFSGIGNAYSDEILWAAHLSPIALTQKLTTEEVKRLFSSTRATLNKWIDLLREEYKAGSGSDRVSPLSKVQGPKSNAQAGMSRAEEGRLHPTGSIGRNQGMSTTVSDGSFSLAGTSDRLKTTTNAFPEKVTAFRPEMAVHGKYQQPCPRCGAKIQRIRYASNETNYCPKCQTGGKLLADRALSRLLRSDWPRSVEELEGLTPSSKH